MIMQKSKPDLETLIQLCERKSPYLTIRRIPESWSVSNGKDHAPAGYESLSDALMNFILGGANDDNDR